MKKIFYADKTAYPDSIHAVQHLLALHFGINNANILKTDNGKPYLQPSNDIQLFFSISHTKEYLFIVFFDKNIGIDAENLIRHVDYQTIIKKFTPEEQNQIQSKDDFLRHWIAKESTVKWLGSTLATNWRALTFINEHMYRNEALLPVFFNFLQLDTHLVCVCSEDKNIHWEFEKF